MGIFTIAPLSSSNAHYHDNCETDIYVPGGSGLFLTGDDLLENNEISTGDFIYVPDGAVHKPISTSG